MIPFQFGDPVMEPLFYDREEILKELYMCLVTIKERRHQDCALISPRRIGKSSILKMLSKKLEKAGITTVYIDLSRLPPGSTFETFLEMYMEFALKSYQKTAKWDTFYFKLKEIMAGAPETIKNFVSSLKFGLEIQELFTFWIEYKIGIKKEIRKLAEKCLELPELLAKETKIPCVILFDEFQEIYNFDKDWLWFIRSIIQNHVDTAYVVSGSSVRLMNEITAGKRAAFYGHFLIRTVGPFSSDIARAFLKKRAKEGKIKFTNDAMEAIISKTNCIPFYLQWLGLHCYLLTISKGKEKIEKQDVEEAYKVGIKQLPQLEEDFSKVHGKTKGVLVYLALHPGAKVTQIAKVLNTRSQVIIKELKTLGKMDYIRRIGWGVYEFIDKIFEDWIKEKYRI